MTFPNLTLATVQRHANAKSYSRGEAYYRSGAVVSVTQRQQTVEADVEGNEARPYRVVIDVDGGGVPRHAALAPTLLKDGVNTSLQRY
ncbi:MAG: hypothetical protein AAGD25_01250 [Cyanobacteria bacterium P01_F01_bin.150]